MKDLKTALSLLCGEAITKIIVSKPVLKTQKYRKLTVEEKPGGFQLTGYTEKQAFHENLKKEQLAGRLQELICPQGSSGAVFRQVNAWSASGEHILLISKDGSCSYKTKKNDASMNKNTDNPADPDGIRNAVQGKQTAGSSLSHNRRKKYILEEGTPIAPLIDMGIFTKDGRVVRSMYDKFRQINRFLEIIDDEISSRDRKSIHVIDFGCGKSYLTFLLYYYLVEIKGISAHIIGLDLKADVIEKCNRAAKHYGYEGLSFELGDINGYHADFPVDMVVTLHACDTATDYALFNAVSWKASMIFSVPCCQHELNGQIEPEKLKLLSRYGIVQERFCALATDAIRANLLEYCGYRTQLLEFIDFEHTPKNILIRAVRRPAIPLSTKEKRLAEAKALMDEFHFRPTLYDLLVEAPEPQGCEKA